MLAGPGRAAVITGWGSGRCPKGDEKCIQVSVLYSELSFANLGLRSSSLQHLWASDQRFDTQLVLRAVLKGRLPLCYLKYNDLDVVL